MMPTASSAKIVCATDFSPNAAVALRWAATTAAAPGDTIDLVTVLAPPTTSFVELTMDAGALDAVRQQAATARLRELALMTEREFGVPVTPYVLTGPPPAAIAEHAEKANARLVVVGARSRFLLDRPVLGSVAERTVRASTRPVAVVPPGVQAARPQAGPSSPPLRVLVGLEGGVAGDRALALARDLRRTRPCDVTVLHLYWPIAEYQRLGLQGSRDLFSGDPDVVRNLEPELRQRIGDLSGQGAVELSIRPAWGDPAANLLAAADEGDYQVMIVGAERRHGFARFWHPSVSRRVVRHASGAVVICVPPAQGAEAAATADVPPRISTVLAPTDLSAAGNAAIPHAYALLAAHGGVVELCHVHEQSLPYPPYAYDERSQDRLSLESVAALEGQLRALVPPYAQSLGVTTHVSIIEGRAAAEAIVQASERLAVDAISLGSRGGGAVARALFGSVAQKVVQNSHKPVMVVPPPREVN
jgi:nucleotide-binding universal stress UspA family protein